MKKQKRTAKEKSPSILLTELREDIATFRRLPGKGKLEFLWDYYRYKILAVVFSIFVLCLFAHMLWEGQKPCRLRACVVLNTEEDCSLWAKKFTETLTADGKPGAVDLNLDQPFDYDNVYYYVQEAEVMTTISSGRMDIAVCGPDMYRYLLALNACLPLDTGLSQELTQTLQEQNRLVYSTANLKEDEKGNVNQADGVEGYFAIDLTGTAFDTTYNQTADAEVQEPLYAVVIRNTEHLADCEAMILFLLDQDIEKRVQ